MHVYTVGQTLQSAGQKAPEGARTVTIYTSDELADLVKSKDAPPLLIHTPLARDVRITKAEYLPHKRCIAGSVRTPRNTRSGTPISFGFLLAPGAMTFCDDSGAVRSLITLMIKEELELQDSLSRFFSSFLEHMVSRDLRRIQELEDRLSDLEDQVVSRNLKGVSASLTEMNQEGMAWMRYYRQLDDMACEFEENEYGFFPEADLPWFHRLERRTGRLLDETHLLREYYVQVREMHQTEIGLQQNDIMKILTVVTTIALPLTILVGWYGMNFTGMPELTWEYGYPAVIVVSILIILLTILWMKKKKFF